MSWGVLPNDLLSAIFQILTKDTWYLPDLYRCLHVCSWWRRVAKNLLHSSAGPVPWLLIPWVQPDKLVFDAPTRLYDFDNEASIAFDDSISSILSLSLPIDEDQCFLPIACRGAWLLLGPRVKPFSIKLECPMFLYNPLSRVLIKLPPLPSPLWLSRSVQFVMSETSPRDPKCILCIQIDIGVLAFCKPSEGCSSSVLSSTLWVLSIKPESFKFYEKPESSDIYALSMIFHKEIFYTIDHDCALYVHSGITDFIINDNNSGTTNTDMRTWPWPVIENKVASSTYSKNLHSDDCLFDLVESKNGELLMVERIIDWKREITTSFNVYKLTIPGSYNYEYCWKQVNRLEENEALYSGFNDSFSISANVSDSNNIYTYKPNCIYFFDEVYGRPCRYGVYNLENNSIQHWDDESNGEEAVSYFCK